MILDLAVDALATYRATRLIREDRLTEPLRTALWRRYPPESTLPGYLLTCPWCLSIYLGAALSVSRIVFPRATALLSRTLALSAVAGIMTEREESRHDDGF